MSNPFEDKVGAAPEQLPAERGANLDPVIIRRYSRLFQRFCALLRVPASLRDELGDVMTELHNLRNVSDDKYDLHVKSPTAKGREAAAGGVMLDLVLLAPLVLERGGDRVGRTFGSDVEDALYALASLSNQRDLHFPPAPLVDRAFYGLREATIESPTYKKVAQSILNLDALTLSDDLWSLADNYADIATAVAAERLQRMSLSTAPWPKRLFGEWSATQRSGSWPVVLMTLLGEWMFHGAPHPSKVFKVIH